MISPHAARLPSVDPMLLPIDESNAPVPASARARSETGP